LGNRRLKKQSIKVNLAGTQRKANSLIIDETGDRKKGDKTDYVKRQYIGNLGKTDNGIVAVTAYGVFCGMTFPLLFEVSGF
jgi:SRSO17 transposase